MVNAEQQTKARFPREVEGKHIMWTLTTVEKAYNDGTTEMVGSYKINKDFLRKLPKSTIKFDENTPLLQITNHFNTNILSKTRVIVVAESFANKRHEGILTAKELKKLKQTITDLSNRPRVSFTIALKFKLMLEYYGITGILADEKIKKS